MITNVLRKEDTSKSLLSFTRKLEKSVMSLLKGEMSISYDSDIVPLSAADIIRTVSEIPVNGSGELSIRNIVLESVIQCEKRHRLSGAIMCLTLCECFRPYSEGITQKDLSLICNNSKFSTLIESKEILRLCVEDKLSFSILIDSLLSAGADGRIVIEKDPGTETRIEHSTGYHFRVEPEELFSRSSQMETWERNNVLCLIVDGIIESPSEIEKILNPVAERKLPFVIFARGYSDDVLSTLAVNFIRGNLDVVPMKVPYDENGINMINDIAVVSGCDVISSLKGELISQKKISDLVFLDSVSIFSGSKSICISKESTKNSVLSHMNFLRKKKENEQNQNFHKEEVSLIENRMVSLSGDSVKIKLGKLIGQKRGIVLDRLNFGIALFKDICSFGIVDVSQVSHHNKTISNVILKTSVMSKKIPVASLVLGIKEACKTYNSMKNIGCVICLDE